METETKIFFILTILAGIVLGLTNVVILHSNVQNHENVHKQNFRAVGVDSNIEIYSFGLGGGKTIPLKEPTRDMTNLELANSITESIGYQLLPPLEMLVALQTTTLFLLLAFFVPRLLQ